MLVSKDRLFCFSFFFLKFKTTILEVKEKIASRRAERQPEYGSIYNLTGSSTNVNTVLFQYLHGLKARKMSPFTLNWWFHFSRASSLKSGISESGEDWAGSMGSNKGLICSALASQKLKTSSFWGSEKAMNREPWPRQVGLILSAVSLTVPSYKKG